MVISIGSSINISIIEDVQYEWYLKIFSKLHKPLGECNLEDISEITISWPVLVQSLWSDFPIYSDRRFVASRFH